MKKFHLGLNKMLHIVKRLYHSFVSKKLVNIHTTWNFGVVGIFESLRSERVFDEIREEEDVEENGWTRLRKMYSYSKSGMPTPQITLISETALCSFLFGMIIGGVKESKYTLNRFIDQNKLTGFTDHLEAKRRLQEKMFLAYAKGGWKLGWRLTAFTLPLILIVTSIATYRNKIAATEYIIAGSFSGALYKLAQGPKPMIAGAFGGGILGALSGITIVGFMKLTGIQFTDLLEYDQDRIDKFVKNKDDKEEQLRQEKLDAKLYYRKTDSDSPDET